MAIPVITTWLNGSQNYRVGRVLYKQYGTDEKLLQLFIQNESVYLKQALVKALQEINTKSVTDLIKVDPISTEVLPDDATNNLTLQTIKAKWVKLYGEMKRLHTEMSLSCPDNSADKIAERSKLALEILKKEKEIIALWQQRDYYIQHGTLPTKNAEQKFEIPDNPIEFAKLLDRVQKYIRKYKLQLTREPSNTVAAAMVEQYTQQLNAIHEYAKNKS